MCRWFALLGALMAIGEARAAAHEDFALPEHAKIVFFGDSITQNGQYVENVAAFLITRFPDANYRVVNRGISSETISGTSEPDHDPPRPDAHRRFARDIVPEKANVLIACFGMNDGNYHPFDAERFARYQKGVNRLIARCEEEAQCQIVICTPPPYDAYRRSVGDSQAKAFGYKFAAIDYDQTLSKYAGWLVEQRERALRVADLHTEMTAHLANRRRDDVSYSFAPDAVHPDATGHLLMAQALLEALDAPAVAARLEVDWPSGATTPEESAQVKKSEGARSIQWLCPIPWPIAEEVDAKMLEVAGTRNRLNRFELVVKNAPAGEFSLFCEEEPLRVVSADELAKGIDLHAFPNLFPNVRAKEVLSHVQAWQRESYSAWRARVAGVESDTTARDQAAEASWLKAVAAGRPAPLKLELRSR